MHVICLSQQVTYILCLWLPDISTFILDFQVTIEVINFMQLFVITKLTKRSLTSKDCLWKLTLNIRLSLLCCNPPDYWRMLLGGWRKGYGDNCHKNRTLLPEIKNHRIAVGGTGSFITSHVLCRSQCQVWGFEWSVSLQRRLFFWVFFCVCVCFFFSPLQLWYYWRSSLLRKMRWGFTACKVWNQRFFFVFLISQVYGEDNSSRLITLCIHILWQWM